MASAAGRVMDDLHAVRSLAREHERWEDMLLLDALIEAANAAGHQVYTRAEVTAAVQAAAHHAAASGFALSADLAELVDGILRGD